MKVFTEILTAILKAPVTADEKVQFIETLVHSLKSAEEFKQAVNSIVSHLENKATLNENKSKIYEKHLATIKLLNQELENLENTFKSPQNRSTPNPNGDNLTELLKNYSQP